MPDTPYSILDNQQRQLQDFYESQEQQLRMRRLPKARHNAEIANMQSGYEAQKFRITSMRTQLDNIRESDIDPTLRDEAMWKLVVPPEHAAAMFPTVKKPTERVPISPPGLVSHKELIQQFAEAAEPVKEWFTREKLEPRTQENLIKQYVGWRETIGYTNYTPGQQRQLDIQWDDLMADRPKYKWDPKSPNIRALRTYGGRITGIAAKKISPLAKSIQTSKVPVGVAYRTAAEAAEATLATREISPLTTPIETGKPSVPSRAEQRRWALGKFIHPLRSGPMPESRILDTDTAGRILREAGGDKEKARQIAKRRGYIL